MSIQSNLERYSNLNTHDQLNAWEDLSKIAEDFLNSQEAPCILGKEIAHTIHFHRDLMGSSKQYESAFDIEIKLLKLSLDIARRCLGGQEKIPFLEHALYYSNYHPDIFN